MSQSAGRAALTEGAALFESRRDSLGKVSRSSCRF